MSKLLAHRHTGKIRPYDRTSYGALTLLLVLVGFVILTFSPSAYGETGNRDNNPLSGSIGITGTVAGPAPTTPAVILNPGNGSSVSSLPVTVSGTCKSGLLISIYANDIFIGSTSCSAGGGFSLPANLFVGSNILVARSSDALDQYGPDSAPVTVNYNAPSLALPGATVVAHQFFLTTNSPEQGGTPGNPLSYGISIVGGVPPYALSIDWGDGKSDLLSRQFEGPLSITHTYAKAGTYRVTIKGTDAAANSAYLQVITIINGPVAATGTTNKIDPSLILVIWPLYVLACLMVLIFFLGERRELHKLRKRSQLVSDY